jgi:hypothetical protein
MHAALQEEAMPTQQKAGPNQPSSPVASPRLPHERDQTTQAPQGARRIIRQAAEDVAQGLVDTDLHGQPGLQKNRPEQAEARPLPGTKRD